MANKSIKGIIIEIDGNTKPLSNALSDLNKDVYSVNQELKNVNQVLKFNPGNAEQVARKLELLGEKAELSEKRVDALKQAQAKMDAEGVDKASDEYQSLSTEIAKAENQQREIAKTAKETQAEFDKVSESTKLLNTYLEATGQSVDDLKNIDGISKLVGEFEACSLGGAGFDKVMKAVAADATGSAKNLDQFRAVLASIETGNTLEGVRHDLEAIGNVNVSGLGSEFDQLSQKSQALDNELKTINQSLKMDPSNIDMVAQKQEVLTQNVSATEGQLQILKSRYSELSSQGLDLGDEEFRNVQREIADLEGKLTGYKSNLADLENAQQRLNTYFEATGTSARDFSNVLGSDLVQKIESGEASSQELANALDKIGASATQNKGDIDRLKEALDSVDSGVSFEKIKSELDQLGQKFDEGEEDASGFKDALDQIAENTGAEKLAEIGDQVGEVGEKLRDFGANAIEASGTVQDSLIQVKTQLGATDEEAKRISEAAQQVYFAGYGESIEDCTEAAILLQQNIKGVTPDNLVNMTEKATTLAQVLGIDNTEAIRGLRGAMAGFGVDADTAMDIFSVAQQRGLNLSQEMLDNIAEYAPRWKDSGVSMEEYFSLFQAGMDTGAYSSDKVLDFLNEFKTSLDDGRIEAAIGNFSQGTQDLFQRYKDGEPVAKECLQAITGELGSMENQSQAATLASEMWSSLGEDNAMDMITAMNGATNSYKDCSGAAQQLVEDNSNSVDTIGKKWQALGMKFAPIGEDLAELANKILDVVGPIIDGIVSGFTSLPEPIQTVIEVIGMLVAGISALGPVINLILPIIQGIVGGFQLVGSAIAAVVGVLGGPLAAAIAAVIAVIVGLIAYFNNWGGCADWLNEKWSEFVTWLGDTFGGLGETLGGAWQGFLDILSGAWDGLCSGLRTAWETVTGWLSTAFSSIGETLGSAWNTMTGGLSQAWDGLCSGLKTAWDTASGNLSSGFDNLKNGLSNTWGTLCSGLGDLWDKTKDTLTERANTIKDNLSKTWDSVKETATERWNTIKTNVSETAQALSGALSSTMNTIKDNSSQAWESVKSKAGEIWNNVTSTVTSKAEEIRGNLQNKWNEVVSNFSQIWGSIQGKASEIWENVKRTVQEGVNRLKDLMNFDWHLPKLDLPRIKIEGNFSLNPPSVPSFRLEWFAKGGILTAPTIFGANGNTLLGGGEAGKEAVAPIDTLTGYVQDAVNNSNSDVKQELSEIKNLLKSFCDTALNKEFAVNIDGKTVAKTVAKDMDYQMGILQRRKLRQ